MKSLKTHQLTKEFVEDHFYHVCGSTMKIYNIIKITWHKELGKGITPTNQNGSRTLIFGSYDAVASHHLKTKRFTQGISPSSIVCRYNQLISIQCTPQHTPASR